MVERSGEKIIKGDAGEIGEDRTGQDRTGKCRAFVYYYHHIIIMLDYAIAVQIWCLRTSVVAVWWHQRLFIHPSLESTRQSFQLPLLSPLLHHFPMCRLLTSLPWRRAPTPQIHPQPIPCHLLPLDLLPRDGQLAPELLEAVFVQRHQRAVDFFLVRLFSFGDGVDNGCCCCC